MADKEVEELASIEVSWLEHGMRNKQIVGTIFAEGIINAGYIHKSRALEMVKLCPICRKYGWVDFEHCPTCKGTGIVLR